MEIVKQTQSVFLKLRRDMSVFARRLRRETKPIHSTTLRTGFKMGKVHQFWREILCSKYKILY